jgi:hypothetical protein
VLNPSQIAHYRPLVAAGTHQHEPEHLWFTSARVEPAPAEVTAPLEQGAMYAADAIFGTPADGRCLDGIGDYWVSTPIARLLRCENARVIGMAALIDSRGTLFSPDPVTVDTELDQVIERNHWNFDGYILDRRTGGDLWATFASRSTARRYSQTALFIANLEPENYGSFIFRQLPQLLALAKSPPSFDVYVAPERTVFLMEALRLLGLPRKPVYTVAEVSGDEFATVLLVNSLDVGGFLSRETVEGIRALVARVAGSGAEGRAARLYVSRALGAVRNPDYRPLDNELEIEALVGKRGFSVVYPETLALEDQIRAFGGARRILGPSGSGMLNSVFATPGARIIDMESHTPTVGQHAMIYASCRHRYGFLFGTIDATDSRGLSLRTWRVDPMQVGEAIDWLERD